MCYYEYIKTQSDRCMWVIAPGTPLGEGVECVYISYVMKLHITCID
jgi:hypothetical protein